MNCQLCEYEKLSDVYEFDICKCKKQNTFYGNFCNKYQKLNKKNDGYLNVCIKIDSKILEQQRKMEEIIKAIIKKNMKIQHKKAELNYLYLGRHAFYDIDDFIKYNVYNSSNINLLFAIFAGLFHLTNIDETYDIHDGQYFIECVFLQHIPYERYKKLKSLRYIAIKNYQKLLNERARTHKGIIDKYNQMHKLHDIFINFTS